MGTALTALDMAFLALETPKTPVNVAGLSVFSIPSGYKGNFVRDLLKQLMKQKAGPPFNLRLSTTLPIGIPSWVEDEHFDLAYHVRHSAVPRPGRMSDLLELASRLHGTLMDRKRPLWELHLIEGLRRNRFALYLKMHHSAIDGIGGIEMMEACMSEDPSAPVRAPWAGVRHRRAPREEKGLAEKLEHALAGTRRQIGLGREMTKLLFDNGMKLAGWKPDYSPAPFTAPPSMFNVPICGARRFAVQVLSLSEIKALGTKAGATVNDIVLAICSGALRRYLQRHKALPDHSLTAIVPVAVRQLHKKGNQITYVGASLATDVARTRSRIAKISESTQHAKAEVAEVSAQSAVAFAVVSQGLVAVLNRLQLTRLLPPPANVTISNVPGFRNAMYLSGAELQATYPLSVLFDGQALNITVLSYRDSVDFGLMACRDAVPDLDMLARDVGKAFADLKKKLSS